MKDISGPYRIDDTTKPAERTVTRYIGSLEVAFPIYEMKRYVSWGRNR